MDSDYLVSIKSEYYRKIEQKLQESENEFKSVEDYVNFVLSEILFDDESIDSELKDAERKKVENELKKLGYI